MTHHITAIIANAAALSGLAERFGPPYPTRLELGLLILPLDEFRLDALAMSEEEAFAGFTYLKPAIASEIARAVPHGRALYIETDYFGGTGGQGAALFDDGALAWKDSQSDFNPFPRKSWAARLLATEPPPRQKSAISMGLARLGVAPNAGEDEFDRLNLRRFRSLEDLGLDSD